LVTGASDGIGKAICEELAQEGFNLILVSRTLSKLQKLAEELKTINKNIQTKVIAYDFSKQITLEDYFREFKDLPTKYDISILVNNVGSDQHVTYEKQKIEDMFEQINLNIKPQTILTKLFFDSMKARNFRSAIISLSSAAANFPFPMKAVYASSKIYNYFLSRSLEEEFKHSNLDFLAVKPLEVSTPMTPKTVDGIWVLSARQCARGLLNDLGYESDTNGHWAHKLQDRVISIFPLCLVHPVLRRFHEFFI